MDNIVNTMIGFQKLYNCGSHYPENLINRIHNESCKDTLKTLFELSRKESSKNQLWL